MKRDIHERPKTSRRLGWLAPLALVAGCSLDPLPPAVRVGMTLPPSIGGPDRLLRTTFPGTLLERDRSRFAIEDMNCFYAYVRGAGIPAQHTSAELNGDDLTCLHLDGAASPLVTLGDISQGESFSVPSGTGRTLGFVGAYYSAGSSCAGWTFSQIIYGASMFQLYNVATLTTDLLSSGTLQLPRALDTVNELQAGCAPGGNPGSGLQYILTGDAPDQGANSLTWSDLVNASGFPQGATGPMTDTQQSSIPSNGLYFATSPLGGAWHVREDFLFKAPNGQSASNVTVSVSAEAGTQTFDGAHCVGALTGGIAYRAAVYVPAQVGDKWVQLPPPNSAGVSYRGYPMPQAETIENNGNTYIHVTVRSTDAPTPGGPCTYVLVRAISAVIQ